MTPDELTAKVDDGTIDTVLELSAFEAAVTDWERYRGFERR
jgi:hypothetical protein